jgi:hypothetical protein
MRTYKIMLNGFIITLFAIAYVHIHVETLKVGYDMQENRKYLSYLVDQNSKLMYNLSRLESPRSLLSSMNKEDIEFSSIRPEGRSINLVYQIEPEEPAPKSGLIGRVFDLFTPDAEARPRS